MKTANREVTAILWKWCSQDEKRSRNVCMPMPSVPVCTDTHMSHIYTSCIHNSFHIAVAIEESSSTSGVFLLKSDFSSRSPPERSHALLRNRLSVQPNKKTDPHLIISQLTVALGETTEPVLFRDANCIPTTTSISIQEAIDTPALSS